MLDVGVRARACRVHVHHHRRSTYYTCTYIILLCASGASVCLTIKNKIIYVLLDSSGLFIVLFTRFSLWSHGCVRAREYTVQDIFAPASDIGSRNEPILARCRFEIRKMQTQSLGASASPGEDAK